MDFPTVSYLDEQGNLSSEYKTPLDTEILLKGYKIMRLVRLVDERMITLQRQGAISFALSSAGEEACSVASAAALELQDWLYPQYRECGILFWRGFSIQNYVHQMFGDSEDLGLGRQMPNHFGCRALNIVQVSSPIGTQIPHAAGCAYAMKLQKEKSIAVCYFGEGATSEGDFHSGLNFAAVRKTPTLFFCRNNGYAISTPVSRQFASEGVAPKGIGYGIETLRVDGNDFFAVYESVRKARQYCLEKGPVLIEAMTYRLGAHSTSDDPSLYRSQEEVDKWKLKCPIHRLKLYLQKQGLWNDEKESEYVQSITDEIQKAIAKAKETAKPPLKTIIENVYFETTPVLNEEFEELNHYLKK